MLSFFVAFSKFTSDENQHDDSSPLWFYSSPFSPSTHTGCGGNFRSCAWDLPPHRPFVLNGYKELEQMTSSALSNFAPRPGVVVAVLPGSTPHLVTHLSAEPRSARNGIKRLALHKPAAWGTHTPCGRLDAWMSNRFPRRGSLRCSRVPPHLCRTVTAAHKRLWS